MLRKIIPFSLIIFIIDQVVKLIVSFNIDLNTSVTVFKDFFYISHVHNYGAAFSILYGNRVFLILISIIALILFYLFLIREKNLRKFDIVIYSLLFGGIIGNLFDRVVYGYVIDFFDIYIFNYNFPIFNIADICIVISMGLIIIDSLRGDRDANCGRK